MCVAELNVSNRDCHHRWYHLVRPCSSSTNLENCPRKLGLEGWEIRCDFCPFCDAWDVDLASFRIIGGGRSPSTTSVTHHHLSRKPSMSLSSTRRESRRGSLSRTDSNTSLTMMTHSVKNRATNARIDSYLSNKPERILSSDSRSALTDEDDDDGSPTESGSSTSDSRPTMPMPTAKPSILGKSQRRMLKMSRSFLNFVK